MKRTSLEAAECPIARSLDVIGDWWSLLIVRDTLSGPKRFSALQKNLGMARNILASRLKDLVARGILAQAPVAEGGAFQEYALTDKGRGLFPVIVALRDWGEAYLDHGHPMALVDRRTGAKVPALVVRAADGTELRAGETRMIRVGGAPAEG